MTTKKKYANNEVKWFYPNFNLTNALIIPQLSHFENKLLYFVSELSRKTGKCFATNNYLITRLQCDTSYITKGLDNLVNFGLVKNEYKRKSNSDKSNYTDRDLSPTKLLESILEMSTDSFLKSDLILSLDKNFTEIKSILKEMEPIRKELFQAKKSKDLERIDYCQSALTPFNARIDSFQCALTGVVVEVSTISTEQKVTNEIKNPIKDCTIVLDEIATQFQSDTKNVSDINYTIEEITVKEESKPILTEDVKDFESFVSSDLLEHIRTLVNGPERKPDYFADPLHYEIYTVERALQMFS